MDSDGKELRDEIIQELAQGAEARFEREQETDPVDVALIALAHPETYEILVRKR